MTDNEIIKALECCSIRETKCISCPYYEKTYCVDADALDLINRQKAEIKRLKKDLDFNIKLNGLLQEQRDGRDEQIIELDEQIDKLNRALQTAKTESIKEVVKKAKMECAYIFNMKDRTTMLIALDAIEKEMAGD